MYDAYSVSKYSKSIIYILYNKNKNKFLFFDSYKLC